MMNFDISDNVKDMVETFAFALVLIVIAICEAVARQRKDAKKESDDK